ncbi:MAG: RluA family pseudouridine synthase [bacterium]|nr:MAG: RluA family pseudouridine synthase [bacterium]
MERQTFQVQEEDSRTRLDIFLSHQCPQLTRSRIKKLVASGDVLVNGSRAKAGQFLSIGDVVELSIPEPERSPLEPEEIAIDILYEDSSILVLDKPPHMVVHPSFGHAGGTLVNALLHHCRDLSGIGGVTRPGIVHRLDKGTSGVMVVAKNDSAHLSLARQFKDHTIRRTYVAAVRGVLADERGTIDRPVGRHPRDRKRIAVVERGRRAVTEFEVVARRGGLTLVELRPGTGRTHQLRVHLSSTGHPVLGDVAYGGGVRSLSTGDRDLLVILRSLKRPALHAKKLGFDHPVTGQHMSFEARPPEDLEGLFSWIRGAIP